MICSALQFISEIHMTIQQMALCECCSIEYDMNLRNLQDGKSAHIFTYNRDYEVLVRVQCHDAMITNEINLFGLAGVEDECKTQTRFIEFVIIPSRHWMRTRTYFSLPL